MTEKSQKKFPHDYKGAYDIISRKWSEDYANELRTKYDEHNLEALADMGTKLPSPGKNRLDHAAKYGRKLLEKVLKADLGKAEDDVIKTLYERAFVSAVNEVAGGQVATDMTSAERAMKKKNFDYKRFMDMLPRALYQQHLDFARRNIFEEFYTHAEEEMGHDRASAQRGLYTQWRGTGGYNLIKDELEGEPHPQNIENLIAATNRAKEAIKAAADVKEKKKAAAQGR